MHSQYPTDQVVEVIRNLEDTNDVVDLSLEVQTVLTTTHEPKSRVGFAFWRGVINDLLLSTEIRDTTNDQEFGFKASLLIHAFAKARASFDFSLSDTAPKLVRNLPPSVGDQTSENQKDLQSETEVLREAQNYFKKELEGYLWREIGARRWLPIAIEL